MSKVWFKIVLNILWTITRSVQNHCQYYRLFNYLWSEYYISFSFSSSFIFLLSFLWPCPLACLESFRFSLFIHKCW